MAHRNKIVPRDRIDSLVTFGTLVPSANAVRDLDLPDLQTVGDTEDRLERLTLLKEIVAREVARTIVMSQPPPLE